MRFIPITSDLTRVELEDRGWERLTEAELTQDCALPVGYDGGAFHDGWQHILECFKSAVEANRADKDAAASEKEDQHGQR